MIIEYKGKSMTVVEWSKETGLNYFTLLNRLKRGWTPERILNTPCFEGRMIEHNGRKQNVAAWARETGIGIATLLKRLEAGWTAERAVTTPLQNGGRKKAQHAVEVIELTAYRDLERMMLGLKNDLQRSLKALAEAQVQAGKALEKAEKNLRSRAESILHDGLGRGVVPNILKDAEHRTHSVAQDRT